MENAKTSTAFLKRDEYIENEELFLNLSDIKGLFFRIKTVFSKTFFKKTISILGIHLLYLVDALGK